MMEPQYRADEPRAESPDQFKSHLVILKPGSYAELEAQMREAFDIRIIDSRRWVPELPVEEDDVARAVIFENLGSALVNLSRARLTQKFADDDVISDVAMHLPGFGPGELSNMQSSSPCRHDESQNSWGRKLTGVVGSAFTGAGIRVCVVDSGLAAHLDFQAQGLHQLTNRQGRARAFTSNPDETNDTLGHGTECAGIICGKPADKPWYSVAPDCRLFIADVYGATASTSLGRTAAAIEWALEQRCQIISMSVYWEKDPASIPALQLRLGQFKRVVDRALRQNAIILACTGNSSDRGLNKIRGCCFPANLPNVLAVGGIDKCKKVFNTANAGARIAGPGEMVITAFHTGGTQPKSGTSMATAFVAGVAALHAQKDPGARGQKLMDALLASVTPLSAAGTDVKTGLVKAP